MTKEQLLEQIRTLQKRVNSLEKAGKAQKQTKDALSASEKNLSAILEKNADGIVIVDTDGVVLYVNPAAEKLFGKTKKDFLGYSFGFPVSADKAEDSLVIRNGDSLYEAELRVVQVQWQKRPAFQLSVRDITERKLAEDELKESEERYRALFNNSIDAVLLTTPDGRILSANPEACRIFGRSEEGLRRVGRDGVIDSRDSRLAAALEERARTGKFSGELTLVRGDGTGFPADISTAIYSDASGVLKSSMIIRDITERKKAEAAHARLLHILESSLNEIYVFDAESLRFEYVNQGALRNLGYTIEEMRSMTPLDVKPEFTEVSFRQEFAPLLRHEQELHIFSTVHRRVDGSRYPVEVHMQLVEHQGQQVILTIILDITDREHKEENLRKLNRTLQAKSKSSHAMMRATDERSYLNEVCRIIMEDCGHALVWIGYAEDDAGKTVRPVAHAGFEEGYLESLKISWADVDRGRGPVGMAIRTGKPAIFRSTVADTAFAPWREEALKLGYAAVVGIPLLSDGKAFGSLNIYSQDQDPFSKDEVNLLVDLAADLAYGIAEIRLHIVKAKAEAALQVSEKRYRSLFENMVEGFAYCRMLFENDVPRDFIYLDVNSAFEKLTGLKNVVGQKVTEVIPGIRESMPELFEIYGRVALTGKPERFESFSESFGGWLSISVYSTEKGYFVAVFDNITEHKRADITLRASEEKYRTLIQEINDGLFVTDDRGTFTFVNNALARIHGYEKPEELVGRNFMELTPLEGREALLQDFSRNMQHVLADRDVGVIDIPIERPDKSNGYIQIHPVQIVENGRIVGTRGIVRDITEIKLAEEALRKSESRYRGLFNNILDGVYESDKDGIFTMINPAGARMFGFSSPEEIIGRSVADFWADPRDHEAFLKVLRQKKSVSLYPIRAKNKKEEIVHLETASNILEDKTGGFLGTEGILRDVTEHSKLEEQLRQSQKFEAIGTLAGGVAHDFNNILSAIIGYGHLTLMKMPEDDPLRYNINQILESSKRATVLTQSLLAYSRKQPVNLVVVDLNVLVRRFEQFLKRLLREDIELKTICAERVLNIVADSGQIEQVLMNLVTNARDAMPDGGRLTIETRLVALEKDFVENHGYGVPGEYALLMATDTGTGMDEQTKLKAFEPFFTTKEVGKGTGLGLAMVYGIVKRHEGYINIYSEVGQGTTVKIYLPLAGAATAIEEKKEALIEPARGGTETVLVAEDDPALSSLTTTILKHFGYTVIEAVDGEDAIFKYVEHKDKIHLVILDGIMPKKNGWQAYEEIRTITPAVKVIFMSGYSEDVFSAKSVLEKGLTYLLKPITPSELLKRVREVLDN